MPAEREGPLGPVGETHNSPGRAWTYMLHAFLIGWDKRMIEVRKAKVGLRNRRMK